MVNIGKYNTLKIVKEVDFGLYLDGEEKGEILLPSRYVPEGYLIGENIDVFVYKDSEDRLIATTEHPYAQVGDFVLLEVKSVNNVGAFLEWGLAKDLLVPFREQKMKMQEGRSYIVYIYLDNVTERIVASAKLEKFLDNTMVRYEPNQEVDLLIVQETELGYKVIINNLHWGMIYHNEIFSEIEKGDRLKGYVKQVREDEKIDVSLQPLGYEKIEGLAGEILKTLKEHEGYLPLCDKTSAQEIGGYFACSKKNFKKAISYLYKQHLILILEDGIRLI